MTAAVGTRGTGSAGLAGSIQPQDQVTILPGTPDRVRGRDRDFHFAIDAENRFIVPPAKTIMEVKANERVPYWLTDLTARYSLQVVRISKYTQSVEAHGRAPRSVFHVPVDDDTPVAAKGTIS
jgi:hypothetical protein